MDQAATMNLMAAILDRALRVARAATSAASAAGDMVALLRQRMPEAQTLLGLRDKIGGAGSAGGEHDDDGDGDGDGKAIFLRWRLLSLLDRYARVIPGAIAVARFDFLKLLPCPSVPVGGAGGRGRGGGRESGISLATMPPPVQLATLRLLARDGVVGAPTPATTSGGGGGGGGGGARYPGWLADKAKTSGKASGGGGGGDGGGSEGTVAARREREEEEASRNTALGAVLRVALDAPSPAARGAARALAVRALQSLGVVAAAAASPPPPLPAMLRVTAGVGEGEGGCAEDGAASSRGEGEAGVWLDLLTRETVGALVLLAREAFVDAQGLMAAGIRAAERRMKENPCLLRGGRSGGGDGGGGRLEGDWEVEFR